MDINKMIEFLLVAKKNTYAATNNKVDSCRMNSHDYHYKDKKGFTYLDSYLGGECFVGEEVVWLHENPVWSMNYVGRVIEENSRLFVDEYWFENLNLRGEYKAWINMKD